MQAAAAKRNLDPSITDSVFDHVTRFRLNADLTLLVPLDSSRRAHNTHI